MNALAWMQSTGVGVALTPEGGLELDGLEHLDDALYTRVLKVARANKSEIISELLEDTKRTPLRACVREEAAPVSADASPLDALARFERDPRGVVAWLAAQPAGQERSPEVRQRLQECVRAEALTRLAEVDV